MLPSVAELPAVQTISIRVQRIRFRPGLCPGPRWGNLQRSPRGLLRAEEGKEGNGGNESKNTHRETPPTSISPTPLAFTTHGLSPGSRTYYSKKGEYCYRLCMYICLSSTLDTLDTIFIQLRSVAKSVGCFQQRLFVCLSTR